MHQVNGRIELDPAGMNLQDLVTSFNIGQVDNYSSVETAWTQQRFIKNIRAVGRCNQDHSFVRIETVHFNQNLVQGLLSFIMSSADTRSAMAADSVDLVNEDYAWRLFFSLFEHVTDTAGTNANKHFYEIRA